MWAVLGFVLLVGLLILRMIEEQRRELQRTKSRLPKPHASSRNNCLTCNRRSPTPRVALPLKEVKIFPNSSLLSLATPAV
jgi:hypothetical protein